MKKALAWLVICAFIFGVALEAFAQASPEKVRAYIKVLEGKLAKAKTKVAKAKIKSLIAAQKARLAALEAEGIAAPPPPPAPVAPRPVVVAPAAAPAGLFGLGLNTVIAGQYIYTGSGSLQGTGGLKGDIVLDDDMIGLGPMIGLSAKDVKYKIGLGGYYGGGGMKGIPVYAGGVINLPADLLGGLESYLTGGLNYVVYGNGQTTGKIGGDVYFGIQGDLGLGLGKTGFEVGYSVVRSSTVTSKGISISVSQPLVL